MRAPRIIVTRPEPDASRFAAELRAAGLAPIVSPAMEIVWLEAPLDLAGVGALAFTSANGVRAFSRSEASRQAAAFVVGEMTAAEARAAGFKTITVADGDVAGLADKLVEARQRGAFSGAVSHISGADQAGDLAAALGAKGVPARRAVLYEARPFPRLSGEALAALTGEPAAEWVALFSPRSAEIFLNQAKQAKASLAHTRAACLSAAVAAVAGRANWAAVEIAAERSSAALIRLIKEKAGRP